MNRNVNLDVMRFFAVLVVVLSHLPAPPHTFPGWGTAIVEGFRSYGGLGVDLFFVLSGFLVSGLLFREYAARGSVDVRRFLVRRGFKIYPAFYVFVVVTVLIRLRAGDTLSVRDVVSELLFVQNYGAHVWSHTWSLAVEEHFYLLLAALTFGLCRWGAQDPLRRIPQVFCVTTVVVSLARAWTMAHAPYATTTHRFPTHLQIDSLFTGVVLAYYFQASTPFVAFLRREWRAVAFSGLLLIIGAQTIRQPNLRYLAGHLMTNAGFGALVVSGVVAGSGLGTAARVLAAIGAQSYSIYLWHAAVLGIGRVAFERLAGQPPSFVQTAAWYLPSTFVIGIGAAKAIELPSLRIRDHFFPPTEGTTLARAQLSAIAASIPHVPISQDRVKAD